MKKGQNNFILHLMFINFGFVFCFYFCIRMMLGITLIVLEVVKMNFKTPKPHVDTQNIHQNNTNIINTQINRKITIYGVIYSAYPMSCLQEVVVYVLYIVMLFSLKKSSQFKKK